MRISSSYLFRNGLIGMQQLQRQLVDTQEKISTGKRFLSPSDDPVATTKIAIFEDRLSQINQYQENITYATNSNELAESVLADIVSTLDRARELVIQANNAHINEDDLVSIGSEIDGIAQELANFMNSKDGVGDFLFSGFQGLQKPFIERRGGSYEYQGDGGERFLQITTNSTISFAFSGKPVFVDVEASEHTIKTSAANQNSADSTAYISVGEVIDQEEFDANYPDDYVITFNDPPTTYNVVNRDNNAPIVGDIPGGALTNVPYAEGSSIVFNGIEFYMAGTPMANDTFFIESTNRQDILTTMYRFSELLKTTAGNIDSLNTVEGAADYQSKIERSLANVDSALLSVTQERSRVGVALQQLDRVFSMHEGLILEVNAFLAETRDLDFAEAATQLSQESFILQASQASFSRISELTIFNYI